MRREDILAAWAEFKPLAGLGLPFAPDQPVEWAEQNDRRSRDWTATAARA